MIELLRKSAVLPTSGMVHEIEIDKYIPLQFRTFTKPLGCGFLTLGNLDTSMLELAIEPNTQAIRGVTLTTAPACSPLPSFRIEERREGLPILSTQFDGWATQDLELDFSVSILDQGILAHWNRLDRCKAIEFKGVAFLFQDEFLSGIQFQDLSPNQMEILRMHFDKAR